MAALLFEGRPLPLSHRLPVSMGGAGVSVEKVPELFGADDQRTYGLDRPDSRYPVTGHLSRKLTDNVSFAPQGFKHLPALASNSCDLNPA